MTLTTLIFAIAVASLAMMGILWPWFDNDKDIPWND